MSDHVLITGGAGFIGTRLARRFVDAGHTVTVLDALIPQVHGDDPATTSPLLRSLDGVATVIHGTVTSTDDLRAALDRRDRSSCIWPPRPAPASRCTRSTGTPRRTSAAPPSCSTCSRTSRTTCGGSSSPRRARSTARARTAPPTAPSSTRATAPTPTWPRGDFDVHMPGEGALSVIPTDENAKLHPSSVYGITKQMQESLIMTVAPTIGIEPVSLRYQNVYGPGQSLKNPYTGILSIFSTLIRQGKEINIFEDGLESRDFVYIDDVVEATFLARDACRMPRAACSTSARGSPPP